MRYHVSAWQPTCGVSYIIHLLEGDIGPPALEQSGSRRLGNGLYVRVDPTGLSA